jgi:ABC-type polysaccharide/polyol phosphate transport system ATPase subunit
MNNNIAISVKNVTKSYKLYENHADRVKESFNPFRKKYHHNFNALSNIDFEVKKGETLGIIGRNGSGKSTLLQIICGILQPTIGRVGVNGRVSALLELGTGFNPEFSGFQNVYINGAILGLTPKEIDERFDDIIAFADIGDFLDQPVKTYSSGMVVRLAFAVIANVDADILVKVYAFFARLQRERHIIVYQPRFRFRS